MPRKQQLDRPQHARFIKAARELECDEDQAQFEERLKTIAKAKPPDRKTAPRPAQKE